MNGSAGGCGEKSKSTAGDETVSGNAKEQRLHRRMLRMARAAFIKFVELVNPEPVGDPIAGPVRCGRCGFETVYEYPPVLEDAGQGTRSWYRYVRCIACKETRALDAESYLGLEHEAKLFGDKLDPQSPAFIGKRLGPKQLMKILRGQGLGDE
ncbi:MAG TPA: hypothetical protein VH208_03610 [Myxococcaceae bacterium]|nr:hypothetical protein [Myxococcaceae bacterium]